MKLKGVKLSPPQFLILCYLSIIILGAGLLKLPFATIEPITWLESFFTSTSVTTVTGLSVVDMEAVFTAFGRTVIFILIQVGGLGIMSFSILIFMMLGKKIGLKERIVVQQALNQNRLGGGIKLIKNVFIYSLVIELIGALLLAMVWGPEYGWLPGSYYSFFKAISAFNNAGISVWSDSLMQYVSNPLVNLVITSLVIIGGIGFTVLVDIKETRSFKKLSLHSKLMISGTLFLNFVSMIIFFALEVSNPSTLGSLNSLSDKIWASYFQVVTARTAGFNTLNIVSLTDSSVVLMISLMFIGAGSASTGGGVKLTTFLTITLTLLTFFSDRKQVTFGYRAIKDKVIFRAFVIMSISVFFVFLGVLILTITESAQFLEILFEVVSAFSTTGLTLGLTNELSNVGKVVISFIMFLGKVGPLTLAFSLAKSYQDNIRYPSEDILTA